MLWSAWKNEEFAHINIIKPQVWSSVTSASLLITWKEKGFHALFFQAQKQFYCFLWDLQPLASVPSQEREKATSWLWENGLIAFAFMVKVRAWSHRGHRCLKALTLPSLRPWQLKRFSSHWVCLLAEDFHAEYTSGVDWGSLSALGIALAFTSCLSRYSALQTTSHEDLRRRRVSHRCQGLRGSWV